MDSGGGRLPRAGTDAVRNQGTDLLTATGAHAEGRGDVRVVKTVVNGGGNVTMGTSKTVTFPIAITVKDNSCVKKSSTTSVCTATMAVDPAWIPDTSDTDANTIAGVWRVDATVRANDGDYWISDHIAEYKVKRASKLTTDASPEPVAKGGTSPARRRPRGSSRPGTRWH